MSNIDQRVDGSAGIVLETLEADLTEFSALLQEEINWMKDHLRNRRKSRMLEDIYQAPPAKIDLIAHGIPDVGFVDPTYFKDQFNA